MFDFVFDYGTIKWVISLKLEFLCIVRCVMIGYIRDIAKTQNIEFVGVCDFSSISSDILHCSGIKKLPTRPKSVIVFLFPYYVDVNTVNVSRYAIVPDYHKVCYKKLLDFSHEFRERFKGFTFSAFIDNSPIPEVKAACEAGLGVIGDNGLLINKKYGSWVFIGEIVTDMVIKDNVDRELNTQCIHCGKCLKSCPGKAIGGKYFNRDKCLSHITQKKGALSSQEMNLLKQSKFVWGCDVCQECCPLNQKCVETPIVEFHKNIQTFVNSENYYNFDDRAYFWRPKNVVERNLDT